MKFRRKEAANDGDVSGWCALPKAPEVARWLICLAFTAGLAASLGSFYFAWHGMSFGTLVMLTLSVLWGSVSVLFVSMRCGPRRRHTDVQANAVEQILVRFLCELTAATKDRGDNGKRWGELVDRLDGIASKALESADSRR